MMKDFDRFPAPRNLGRYRRYEQLFNRDRRASRVAMIAEGVLIVDPTLTKAAMLSRVAVHGISEEQVRQIEELSKDDPSPQEFFKIPIAETRLDSEIISDLAMQALKGSIDTSREGEVVDEDKGEK